MKMFGFVLASLLLGGAIAAYIKLPKDDDTKAVIKLIKFFIAIMVLTLGMFFSIAVLGSGNSIKLF
jgi:hypothetical protein